jgi:hypothetical protein
MATPRPVPQLPWGWRSMWVIAMFDLPTETPAARRAYSQFRKHLLEDGFTMMQFSVYARHCANIENSDMHVKRMGESSRRPRVRSDSWQSPTANSGGSRFSWEKSASRPRLPPRS